MPRVTPESTTEGTASQEAEGQENQVSTLLVGLDEAARAAMVELDLRVQELEERLTSPVVEQIEGQVETLVADLFRARFSGQAPRRDSLSVEVWEGTPTPHGLVRFFGHEVFRCNLPAVTDPEEYVARAFSARLHRLLSSDL